MIPSFKSKNNTYVQNKIIHPILYYNYIQMIHYNNHVDILVMVYIYHIFHHKILIYNDILLVLSNILKKNCKIKILHRFQISFMQVYITYHSQDHNLFDKLVHHKDLLANQEDILHHHFHYIYNVNVHFVIMEIHMPYIFIKT